MRIAILGSGNVGSAIAMGLAGKGFDVTIATRDPERPAVRALAAAAGAATALPFEAAGPADIIILALPWAAAETAVAPLAPFAGRVVIDCMNPLGMVDGKLALMLGHTTSGGETVQSWLPRARVVKTLNQVGAGIMARNDHLGVRPLQFMAGDDDAAKADARTVAEALGFEVMDAGGLVRARLLEPLAMVWINQALYCRKGRDWALAAATPVLAG